MGPIITGGIAPNIFGKIQPFAIKLTNQKAVEPHNAITSADHDKSGTICMQSLQAGRYAYSPLQVALRPEFKLSSAALNLTNALRC